MLVLEARWGKRDGVEREVVAVGRSEGGREKLAWEGGRSEQVCLRGWPSDFSRAMWWQVLQIEALTDAKYGCKLLKLWIMDDWTTEVVM